MITKPIDVLEQFPVRKSKEQKAAFEQAAAAYARENGWVVHVEEAKRGARNIVIGDPENARYLLTAHYDTPASIGLPNLIVPNNPVLFFLIQFLLVGVLLAVSVGIAYGAFALSGSERIGFLVWYVVYFGLLILMLKGPANKHNANDNTSGVMTVLEILTSLPEAAREKVCFVLFDMEEAGLVGSGAYRKLHKDATETQVVLNMDCVGNGDVIQMTPIKKARKDQALIQSLAGICGHWGGKELRLRDKGFYAGSSDHKNFPFGVAVMAFQYKKGIGLYCGRIHTWRDTVLDYENVKLLRDRMIAFLSE